MTRITQPSSTSMKYLRKKTALHKQLRAELRAERKARKAKKGAV